MTPMTKWIYIIHHFTQRYKPTTFRSTSFVHLTMHYHRIINRGLHGLNPHCLVLSMLFCRPVQNNITLRRVCNLL